MAKKKTKMLEVYDYGDGLELISTDECDAKFKGKWRHELYSQVAWAYNSAENCMKGKLSKAGAEPLCMVDLRQKKDGEVSAFISYRGKIAELSDGPMGPFETYQKDIQKATQKLLKRLEGK